MYYHFRVKVNLGVIAMSRSLTTRCSLESYPGYPFTRDIVMEMKKAVTKVIDTLTQEDFHGPFQKLLAK